MFNLRARTSTKLWWASAIVAAFVLALSAASYVRLQTQRENSERIIRMDAEILRTITQWKGLTELNLTRTLAILKSSDPSMDALFKSAMTQTTDKISSLQKAVDAADITAAEREQLKVIGSARQKVLDLRKAAKDLKAAGNAVGAAALIDNEYVPATTQYLGALDQLQQMHADLINANLEQMRASDQRIAIAAAIGSLIMVGLVVFGAAWLARSITQPLGLAVEQARRIAAGDLSHRMRTERADEIGDMMRALDEMTEALTAIVGSVREGTDHINGASTEIATGNQDLSNRTEQQASSLQEAAASMEQLTSTVKQSADSARQATQLAEGASQVARKGGDVVDRVISAMTEIDQQSKKIADIIGVIDGIAFQTNILALNAAVEAARAGEQGRGFAVVAGEVRALAQRSASAAREIKTLITASVNKVGEGTDLVKDAGTTMTEIVNSVQRVNDLIAEISSATQEQSSGISQVNQAVGHLDQMTQQNAALVEQSAAAAHALTDQAHRLSETVSKFRTAG